MLCSPNDLFSGTSSRFPRLPIEDLPCINVKRPSSGSFLLVRASASRIPVLSDNTEPSSTRLGGSIDVNIAHYATISTELS